MKLLTLMMLALVAVGCAHKFHPERSISSVDDKEQPYDHKKWMEPRGSRY